MKPSLLFLLILSILACNQDPSVVQNEEPLLIAEKKEIHFTDLIPEDLSDSLKINRINKLVTQIDLDSTLQVVTTSDSSEIPFIGFFRNDSLLKITKGYDPGPAFRSGPGMKGIDYTSYYFLLDSLIYSKQVCNSYQQTSRCNPVYLSIDSYFYQGELFSTIVDDRIGIYHSCGCEMRSEPLLLNGHQHIIKVDNSYLNKLRALILKAKKQ